MSIGRRLVMPLVLALIAVASVAPVGAQPVRPPWRSQVEPLATAGMAVGGVPLTVELAVAPAAKARGLGYRAGLEPGTGMLFVDEAAEVQNFWMGGMRFCLDIVWIEDGAVVGATENICPAAPGSTNAEVPRTSSGVPVRYVLEVPAGWMAAHGLGAGSPVSLPAELASA